MTDHEIDEAEAVLPEAVVPEEEEEETGEELGEHEGPELSDGGIVRRLLAEFLGTFFLALVIASVDGSTAPALVGLSAAVLFFLFGPVSGGHFNPVVTAAVGLLGRIRAELAWVYLFVQFTAGFAAYGLVWAMRPPLDDAARSALRASVDHLVGARQGQVPWFLAQWPLLILLPALLVAAVLAARDRFRQEPQAAAWIGAAVGATFWLGNMVYPAASVPDVVFNGYASAFQALPVLVLFPLIGAYIGALLYRELVAPRPVAEAEEAEEDEEDTEEEEEEADSEFVEPEPEDQEPEPEEEDTEAGDQKPEPEDQESEQDGPGEGETAQETPVEGEDSQQHESS
ncbi:aquaporin [Segniliparus rugosus]|uniref:MIP family channel protein n=1 Tax=Segniliparus rugosus (strain ATCC BAA-974 / DSM 45345 / CCUG 50838 / CIP 108380 / JCM 13579 / CDC 945) TaxID=679197 RepID=E5XR17_SEGRC|nr:aquaporin [Segniliparus rugosus]EFV13210.1 hypothetical protein HMPREF9336_01939 [Segniliparus rugosus ATCC BAA-974]